MAAPNVQPLFSRVANLGYVVLTTGFSESTGVDAVLLFTADPTNGSFIASVVAMPLGTNVASVLRVFVNNGSAFTTASNNTLWNEASLPATTVTQVAAQSQVILAVNFAVPPSYRLGVLIGTTVSAGWGITALGGTY